MRKVMECADQFGVPVEIVEMANLGPSLTNLPKVIHIWHSGDRMTPHAPRVKVSFYSDRFDVDENVSISISDHPTVVAPKGFVFNSKFTKKDFELIALWIASRKEVLLRYWRDASVTVDEILK